MAITVTSVTVLSIRRHMTHVRGLSGFMLHATQTLYTLLLLSDIQWLSLLNGLTNGWLNGWLVYWHRTGKPSFCSSADRAFFFLFFLASYRKSEQYLGNAVPSGQFSPYNVISLHLSDLISLTTTCLLLLRQPLTNSTL